MLFDVVVINWIVYVYVCWWHLNKLLYYYAQLLGVIKQPIDTRLSWLFFVLTQWGYFTEDIFKCISVNKTSEFWIYVP